MTFMSKNEISPTTEPRKNGFRITAKGWLALHTGMSDKVWVDFCEFVARQAKQDGMDGTPCLVMKDGGTCITAEHQ